MRGGCPLCVKVAANLKSPVPSSDPTPDKMRVQILSPQRILRFWEWRWEMRNLYFSLCLSMLIAGCRLQINKSYLISDNILLTSWLTNQPKKLPRTYFQQSRESPGPMYNSIISRFRKRARSHNGIEWDWPKRPGASRTRVTTYSILICIICSKYFILWKKCPFCFRASCQVTSITCSTDICTNY